MAESEKNARRSDEAERSRHISATESVAFATMLLGLLNDADTVLHRLEHEGARAAEPAEFTAEDDVDRRHAKKTKRVNHWYGTKVYRGGENRGAKTRARGGARGTAGRCAGASSRDYPGVAGADRSRPASRRPACRRDRNSDRRPLACDPCRCHGNGSAAGRKRDARCCVIRRSACHGRLCIARVTELQRIAGSRARGGRG